MYCGRHCAEKEEPSASYAKRDPRKLRKRRKNTRRSDDDDDGNGGGR
jgi:hypothetical protein